MARTIPNRRSVLGGSVAAVAAATVALGARNVLAVPPQEPGGRAFALGRQMRDLVHQHDKMDCILVRMPDGPERAALEQRFDAKFEDIEEIGQDAASVPAKTLGDVCMQAAVVLGAAERLLNSDGAYSTDDEELLAMMAQASANIVLASSNLGGIDLGSIWWSDLGRLAKRHAAGGEVA